MIKLQNILQEHKHRSKRINNDKYNSLLDKFYRDKKEYIMYDTSAIYRGVKNKTSKHLYIQPSKYIRKSHDTQNYYTLIIDNSKYWKEYPKRSKSIVCSSSIYTASVFGNGQIYRVFPKYNAKIGVCPENDIWHSFDYGLKLFNKLFNEQAYFDPIDRMFDLNMFFEKQFKIKRQDNYNTIVKKINQYELDDEQKQILKKYKCNTLFEFIDYCLNPKLNKFKLTLFNEKFDVYIDRELWTDADSLLIKEDEDD